MSWRFRKTFKVLPGVKLNLTRHGLSTTLGAAPFSVNVGPRGVYSNVSIPGTGRWNRERLDVPSPQRLDTEPTRDVGAPPQLPFTRPVSPPALSSLTEIRSASTESLSSESLERLRRLLKDAYDERDVLAKEISSATLEANVAKSRYENWEHGFLMKRMRKQSFAARKEAFDTAVAKLEELQEQLRQTTLATEITIDRAQAEPYYLMRDDFASLSGCHKIWSVLTEQAIDRIKERSTANTSITRDPVGFSLNSCDLIQWEQKVPHLPNRTGGDMYIYPGFILYRASKQAFALIDFREVTLTFVSMHFTEKEAIPSDAQTVGHTWAKSNKDGSPDRRFHGNYQIPVAHYGELSFTSPDGLDVRYLCSDPALAKRLATAWVAFRMSFSAPKHAEERVVEKANEPFATHQPFIRACENFKAAHEKFVSDVLTVIGKNTTMLKEDFMAYMAIVVELIDAAKGHVQNSDMSPSAKGKWQRAIENFAVTRTHFETLVREGGMIKESVPAYFDALTEFLNAIGGSLNRTEPTDPLVHRPDNSL
jgi:hypothetical protein